MRFVLVGGAIKGVMDMRARKCTLPDTSLVKPNAGLCSENQLTGIRTARYAIGMKLAMRIVQWLERPASAFVYAAEW